MNRKVFIKLASILDIVTNSEGIVFIYSNKINSGIIPLILLEQNGYKNYSNNSRLQYPEWVKGEGNKTKREPISYEGILKSNCKTKFKQATYMVIDTFISKSQLSEQLDIVNHVSNSDGRNIKLIIGSKVASEGLDFKNIRICSYSGSMGSFKSIRTNYW